MQTLCFAYQSSRALAGELHSLRTVLPQVSHLSLLPLSVCGKYRIAPTTYPQFCHPAIHTSDDPGNQLLNVAYRHHSEQSLPRREEKLCPEKTHAPMDACTCSYPDSGFVATGCWILEGARNLEKPAAARGPATPRQRYNIPDPGSHYKY
jgi:hypothetical protein